VGGSVEKRVVGLRTFMGGTVILCPANSSSSRSYGNIEMMTSICQVEVGF
jgi:hypothetical protein